MSLIYDVLLKHGTVLDPLSGRVEAADLAVVEGKIARLTGVDITRCPVCGVGQLHVTGCLAPLRRPQARPGGDTS